MRKGQLDAALHDVDSAAAAFQGSSDWPARFRVQKAHILMLRGSYLDSLLLLSPPLSSSISFSDAQVERLMVQGLDYKFLQRFDEADRSLAQAETLAASIHSPLFVDVAQSRGMFWLDQRDFPKARAAFTSVLELSRNEHQSFREVLALGSLGNTAMGDERYDEAIEWFRLALQKAQQVGSVSSQALAYGNLGWNYSAVGDFENAEVFLTDAIKKSEQAGLVSDQTYWTNSLAAVYFQQRRYPEAQNLARKAYSLATSQDDKGTLTQCLNTLSEIALATGRLDDADLSNRQAARIENDGLDQFGINFSQLIAGRIALGKRQFPAAIAAFRHTLADPKVESPLKWEAHARLAQVFAAQNLPVSANREFDLAVTAVRDAFRSIQRDEFRISFLAASIDLYDSYVNFLISQHRPLDALAIADLSRSQFRSQSLTASPDLAPQQSPLPNLQGAARRLNATLLFYWIGWDRSWLWIITPGETSLLPMPPGSELAPQIKSYLASFTGPRDPLESSNSEGAKLYAELVQPAEKLLSRSSRIFILPDDVLNTLNFETLVVPSPKPHYWIEDATLVTANSLSRLSGASPFAPPNQENLLLMGDAIAASPDFPPLPQAGREVALLNKYFEPARRLEFTGKAATPSAFLGSSPEKFSYLHFATHGTASSLRPLESAVILSPEGDSYKLYARDVVQHPLNAYLVTISACNGAGVKTYAGEGLVGLSWAFLHAGAHNVIAGLWEVSNASTPQLMDELYKGLHAGQDPATALRNAKLSLLHSSGNYRRPFYWAPFLLYSGA